MAIKDITCRYKSARFWLRILLIAFLPVASRLGLDGVNIDTWEKGWQVALEFFGNPTLVALFAYTLYQTFEDTKPKGRHEA